MKYYKVPKTRQIIKGLGEFSIASSIIPKEKVNIKNVMNAYDIYFNLVKMRSGLQSSQNFPQKWLK
jgi:hypothetical protein